MGTALEEAEAFVRRALARGGGRMPPDQSIRKAAEKIVKAFAFLNDTPHDGRKG